MITSVKNPHIQWIRKLQAQSKVRRAEHAFVVEGVRLVEEALDTGWEMKWVCYTENLTDRGQRLVARFQETTTHVEVVAPHVMQVASDTQSPQGILAVVELQSLPLPQAPDFVLIPDGIRDPGNLGTLLRTAAAAGVQVVLLPPDSVDAFAPKVVRAAMGAQFRLPIYQMAWEMLLEYLKPPVEPGQRPRLYLADVGGGSVYTEANFLDSVALIIGGEAMGAGSQARQHADALVHIPMPGKIESLNAAVAAAILLYEVVRQRIVR